MHNSSANTRRLELVRWLYRRAMRFEKIGWTDRARQYRKRAASIQPG